VAAKHASPKGEWALSRTKAQIFIAQALRSGATTLPKAFRARRALIGLLCAPCLRGASASKVSGEATVPTAIRGTPTAIMWGLSPAPLARPDPLGREAPLLRASAAGGRHLASLDPVLDRPRERALKAFTGRPLPGVSGTVSPRCQAWLRLQVACFVASAKEGRGPLIGPQGRARRDVDMPGLARICLKHKQQTTRVFAPLCATHGIGYLCTGTHTVVRLPRALLLRPSGR